MNRRTELVQRVIDLSLAVTTAPVVLDAGCGSASELRFGMQATVVGLDISPVQLERNRYLAERIVGDLQEYQFNGRRFDFIVCWDVLEHLPYPDRAVENLLGAVRPDGLIILGFPNLFSLKGLLTKFTPHGFHRLVYRVLQQAPNPGRDGNPPFETFLRCSMTPASIRRIAEERGFLLEGTATADVTQSNFLSRHRVLSSLYKAADQTLRFLTLGLFQDSEIVLVLRRNIAVQEAEEEAVYPLSIAAGGGAR